MELRRDTPRTQLHFLPPSRLGVLLFGSKFIDDTIYGLGVVTDNLRSSSPDQQNATTAPPSYLVELAVKAVRSRDEILKPKSDASRMSPLSSVASTTLERKVLMVYVRFPNDNAVKDLKLHPTDERKFIEDLMFNESEPNSVASFFKEGTGATIKPAEETSGVANDGIIIVDLDINHGNWTNVDRNGMIAACIVPALTSSDGAVDFASFDTNNDGILQTTELSIGFIMQGYETSFNSTYVTANLKSVWGVSMTRASMVILDGIRIISAFAQGSHHYYNTTPNPPLTIGIAAHELGHNAYGFADVYDYDYQVAGLGAWSLMANGSWGRVDNAPGAYGKNPSLVDAYNLVSSGIVVPTELSKDSAGQYQVSSPAAIYRVKTDKTNQYFLLQSRANTGRDVGTFFAVTLSGQTATYNDRGLLVLHVDENIASPLGANSQAHPRVSVEEAHGGYNLLATKYDGSVSGNGGDLGDLFGNKRSGVKDVFDGTTTPNTNLYAANASDMSGQTVVSGIRVYDIEASTDNKVSFRMGTATVAVTGVSLNKNSTTLASGVSETLVPTIIPSNATNKNVTWSTSDGTIATVSSTGVVTAVAAGTTTITVTSVADTSKTASCAVTVTPVVVPVASVSLNKATTTIVAGLTEPLTATVLPDSATSKDVTWSTSDGAIATVSSTGVVTAVAAGTTTITVTSVADTSKTASCAVTVTVSVTGVSLNITSKDIKVGASFDLTATVSPDNATNKSITWNTTSADIASFDVRSGDTVRITAQVPGKATITVSSDADPSKAATCTVTIISADVPVTGVTLDITSKDMKVGANFNLTAAVAPADATSKDVRWSSSNASIATVSEDGVNKAVVKALSVGKATITVTTVGTDASGKVLSADCTVTIVSADISVTGVTLNKTSTTIEVGHSETLTATVSPASATDRAVMWSSDKTDVATVGASGMVMAHKLGTATITVTTVDGEFTARCIVNTTKTPPIPPAPEPVKPVGTPEEVDPKKPKITENIPEAEKEAAIAAAAKDMKGIVASDLDVSDGVVVVKASVALRIAQQADPANKSVVPLPLFSTDVSAEGNTAMVAFGISGGNLMASTPDKVKVMKILSGDKGEFFTYQSEPSKFADKAFTIMNQSDDIVGGAIASGNIYKLVLFIKDGGSFDLDGAPNGKIVDPAAIVGTSSTPGGSSPTPNSAGGSGCNAGYAPFALMLALALPLVFVRKRR